PGRDGLPEAGAARAAGCDLQRVGPGLGPVRRLRDGGVGSAPAFCPVLEAEELQLGPEGADGLDRVPGGVCGLKTGPGLSTGDRVTEGVADEPFRDRAAV